VKEKEMMTERNFNSDS